MQLPQKFRHACFCRCHCARAGIEERVRCDCHYTLNQLQRDATRNLDRLALAFDALGSVKGAELARSLMGELSVITFEASS